MIRDVDSRKSISAYLITSARRVVA